jgi:cysteine desulfurase/selenocysteine lyase
MPIEAKNNRNAVQTPVNTLDVAKIRADFPVLDQKVNGNQLVYLDSAATSQKPLSVINALNDYYLKYNANIHRGIHALAEEATQAYEMSRRRTAQFLGGVDPDEIIFTSGTTEAINLLARSWGEENISAGDEIVVTEMEHHANFVPWILLAQKMKAVIKRIPITLCGHLDLSELDSIITPRTKLVTVTHMSNVLGTINSLTEITEAAHKNGAVVVVDGAQGAPHLSINLKALNVDFYAFSAHKMLGPTGVGVLWGRRELLEAMPPFITGGEMIRHVSFEKITFNELPYKFEAGTPNIGNVIAFRTALDYLDNLGMDNIRAHEIALTQYCVEQLTKLDGIEIQGPLDCTERGAAISFTYADIHPHDIGTFLDSRGIAIRVGHHCAQPLMRAMGKVATARASLYIYNNQSDVDTLVETLIEMRKYFGV